MRAVRARPPRTARRLRPERDPERGTRRRGLAPGAPERPPPAGALSHPPHSARLGEVRRGVEPRRCPCRSGVGVLGDAALVRGERAAADRAAPGRAVVLLAVLLEALDVVLLRPSAEGEVAVHGVRVPHFALDGAQNRAVVRTQSAPRSPTRRPPLGDARELQTRGSTLIGAHGPLVTGERAEHVPAHPETCRLGVQHQRRRAFEPEELADVDRHASRRARQRLERLELERRGEGFAETLGGFDLDLGVVNVRKRTAEPPGRAEHAEPRVRVRLVRVAVDLLLHRLQAKRFLPGKRLQRGVQDLPGRGGIQPRAQVAVLHVQRIDGALQLADLLRLRAELVLET